MTEIFSEYLAENEVVVLLVPLAGRRELGLIDSIEALIGISRLLGARVPKLN